VVVDPRRTPAADRADRFLAVRPGTDVALAMAAAAELDRRGLADRDFLAEHAEGVDEYLAACAEWTVERAAEVCGPDAPLLRVGWGMERNRNGGSAHRAVLSLWVVAGAFGRPGAGVVGATSPDDDPTGGAVREAVLGDVAFPDRRIVNMNRFGAELHGEGGPIDVLFVQGSNPAATCPNQVLVHEGLAREDLFTVVHDQVLTDTARFADVVLPATTSFEVDDLVAGYGSYVVQDAPAVIPPVGESRPNNAVAHGLAVRLGFDGDAFDPSPDRLKDLMLGRFELPLRLQAEGQVQFRDLWPRHAGSDSRRARLVTDNPTADRLPTYRENDVTGGTLILLTPATNRTITSMFGEYDPPDASIRLHPADAAERGLEHGQSAVVTNGAVSLTVPVAVDDTLRPGVVSMPKGLWCTATPEGLTANAFAPDTLSDLAGGARFNDAMVEVHPA
jgi:anaerobic selenocysteine-containing dehydrogenase